jgi:hypothetical protein
MVPKDWQHPTKDNGDYKPLHDSSFEKRLADWEEGQAQWEKGFREDWAINGKDKQQGKSWKKKEADETGTWEDWDGEKPEKENYMPVFKEGTATHLMMYETCTEGTPISPAFATPEELAHWLADNGASAFGDLTATYEQWLCVAKSGYAPSAIYTPKTGLISGVEASTL